MISCKFFSINGNSFQRKTYTYLLYFTVVLGLYLKHKFISEQSAERRFGALLEISDKFITKFNVFSYIILQFRLKTVSKI